MCGDVAVYWWICGGFWVDLWWFIGLYMLAFLGDVVTYWWRCGDLLVEMWWLVSGDVVAYKWK